MSLGAFPSATSMAAGTPLSGGAALSKAPPRLLVIGDSVVLGATEVVRQQVVSRAAIGFVEHLLTILPEWQIFSDGAVHRTSVGACEVLPALLAAHRPDVVFFMIGGSDADIDWRRFVLGKGRPAPSNVPIDRFTLNLNRICDLCAAAGAAPVFMDMPACDLPARTRWLERQSGKPLEQLIENAGGQSECDRRMKLYVHAVESVSAARGLSVARWADQLSGLPPERRFGADGFHPSEAAHPIIAATVARAVREIAGRGERSAGATVAACA